MEAAPPLARHSTARSLAREVLIRGPISRAELAGRLDLSVASLTRLSKPLLASGFLRESEEQQAASIGRPTRLLEVSPASCSVPRSSTGAVFPWRGSWPKRWGYRWSSRMTSSR
ncbi:putative ArsR family transcriptional regulator [Arthrobacter sp. CAN_A6]|uniref:hypothetical protein n=1 Tax=Arthrobacter sp. CAN_A6 TaxID=2787721 RepID=UPI0018C9E5BB